MKKMRIVGAVAVVGVASLVAGVPQASGQDHPSNAWTGDANTSWFEGTASILCLCERTGEIGIGRRTVSERLERLNAQHEIDMALVRRIEEATSTYPRTIEEKEQRDQELKVYFDLLFRNDLRR